MDYLTLSRWLFRKSVRSVSVHSYSLIFCYEVFLEYGQSPQAKKSLKIYVRVRLPWIFNFFLQIYKFMIERLERKVPTKSIQCIFTYHPEARSCYLTIWYSPVADIFLICSKFTIAALPTICPRSLDPFYIYY